MNRRDAVLALAAPGVTPLAAYSQQPKMPLIGFLSTSSQANQGAYATAFAQRLRELGWIEGRTVAIEYRWGDGRSERLAELVAELVRLKVDVIVTGGTRSSRLSRRHRSFRSSLGWQSTRLAAAWLQACPGRAATSLECRSSPRILPASGSEYSGKYYLVSAK